jgi:hypothetical protein
LRFDALAGTAATSASATVRAAMTGIRDWRAMDIGPPDEW